VQTIDNLGRKNWRGNKLCQFCPAEESADHLFFRCPGAVFLWAVVRDSLEWKCQRMCGISEKTLLEAEGAGVWGLCGFYLVLSTGLYGLIEMILFSITR
jgi:hypothetical protein